MSFTVERGRGKQRSFAGLVPEWLLVLGAWTLAGVMLALIAYSQYIGTGRPSPPWWEHLRWTLAQYYVWWALTPLIVFLVRRFPLEGRRWPRLLPVYAASALFFPFAAAAIFASIYWVLAGPLSREPGSFGEFVRITVFSRFQLQVMIYLALLAVLHAVDYRRKYRERELQLAQMRLGSLKAQLQPHFLFNTLNAVSELVYRDPEAAERTIINLSDLLRSMLETGEAQLVSLKDDLDFLRKYVEIHRTIMQDRVAVEFKIEPETACASVPSMILQPLVENAMRHGIDPVSRSGRIEISAARESGTLRLTVSDCGPGLPEQGQLVSRSGIGLANTQARLAHLYGRAHRFEMNSSPGQGLTVSIFIPFEESGTSA